MSEVTKIHFVDGSKVTVNENFIDELNKRKSVTQFQSFNNKVIVNMNNVTYMEVLDDD